jgi:sugar/nucleoside kinase (ribokinase family)
VTPSVVCVGDVMIDIVATLAGSLVTGSDSPAPIRLLGGGSAANTAAWLVTAGATSTLVGRIGSDDLGRLAADELRAAGVDARLVIDPQARTGSCIVLVDPSGERTMVPDSGANTGLIPADLDPAVFGTGRHLHLSAYSLFHGAHGAALAAMSLARRSGMTISVDAASAAPLTAHGGPRFAAEIGRDVLVLANLSEAQVLTGQNSAESCARALGATFGQTVVKLGARGALWSDGRELVAEVPPATQVVDTTGAGDAFAAGLLASWLIDQPMTVCLERANRLAAVACGRVGGRPEPRTPS